MPTAATKVAHNRPMTTIFKWVPRSALYMEWFIATSQFLPISRGNRAQGFNKSSKRVHSKQPTGYWDSLVKRAFTER
jgi:hypothetical protein